MTITKVDFEDDNSSGGYWCLFCGRYLAADSDGLIIHDEVPHPCNMTFDEDDRPQ